MNELAEIRCRKYLYLSQIQELFAGCNMFLMWDVCILRGDVESYSVPEDIQAAVGVASGVINKLCGILEVG